MGGPLVLPATSLRGLASGRLVGRSSSGEGRAELLTAEQVRNLCGVYSTSQVDTALSGKVDSSDSRLSDARTPTIHSHSQSDVTGLVSALAAVVDTASANDQAFSGTITWTGTTAPSGTATTRYSWVRVGKLVFFEFRFSWTTNGSSLTAAVWNLPGDMPVPASQTGQDPSEVLLNIVGSASFGQFEIANPGAAVESRLQLDASSVAQARVRFSGTNLGCLSCSGVYRCV